MNPKMNNKYVVAFNGKRDDYQVPLALEESGLLNNLETNFYAPEKSSILYRFLPQKLKKASCNGLPFSKVNSNYLLFFLNAIGIIFRLNMSKIYKFIDKRLSIAALKKAKQDNCHLFLYSQYAYWAFKESTDRKKILFQFHPLRTGIFNILKKDYEAFPEVKWSYENENDSQPILDTQLRQLEDEWRYADRIICASSFTKKTLVAAGCEPNKVKVIPYGFSKQTPKRNLIRDKNHLCNFLFVGQGVQRKGLHHLLNVWGKCNLNAVLTLVCSRIDPGLKGIINNTSNIRLKSNLTKDELDNQYIQSDIFVMPSLVEGFGLVYLEAIQNGCYCIGTENTGLPDLHLTNDCVSICAAGDLNDLETKLLFSFEKWKNNEIDRELISNVVNDWSWQHFREEIATEALNTINA